MISNIVKVISFLLYNQVLHNVVWVAITAVIEVFFFAVLGLCSVLVTIVMSLDEAYRRYQEVRFTDNVRPEREAFEPGIAFIYCTDLAIYRLFFFFQMKHAFQLLKILLCVR